MKNKITNNSISIMGGVCFILFASVCTFSANTPFSFLFDAITKSLGFIGFWLLLPYIIVIGIYLILYKRIIKLKVGTRLWGVLLILFCFIILSSHWATIGSEINGVVIVGYGKTEEGLAKYLTFSSSIDVFNKVVAANPSVVAPNVKLGGGQIGYILAGALNSALTPIGLHIVCWSLFIIGLLMIFNTQVNRLFKNLKLRLNKGRSRSYNYEENEIDEIEPTEPLKVEEDNSNDGFEDNRPIFETFHTSNPIDNDYSLKKARFSSIENDSGNVIPPEPMSAPSFEASQPVENHYEEEEDTSYREPFFEPLSDKAQENKPIENNAIAVERVDDFESEEEVEKPLEEPLKKPVSEETSYFIKNYIYPSMDLLNPKTENPDAIKNEEICQERTDIINKTFEDFKVGAQVISHIVGPSVTRFDLQTNSGTSVQVVQRYITDIGVRLGGIQPRFEPIVAGKSTSGIEIPNVVRENVTLKEVLEPIPNDPKHRLDIPFGKSISGDLISANLADFPHLLVAGTTGSGKSIFVHAAIISLLMRNKPEELKFVMIDPKKVEMTYYENIPHLLCPVISDMRKAKVAFDKLVLEMDRRYELFRVNAVRDIKSFNLIAKDKGLQPLPYIVVFIDEYADLIETNKEIRSPVVRIVQKARAAGIHLCLATQRPSVNVVDGVIKGNVSTRVALMCASQQDSMVVIGEAGAEKLLGYGDMLVECPLISRSMKPRVQGCYVSEKEILRVCDFLREHYQPQFDPNFLQLEPVVEEKNLEEPEVVKFDKEKTDEEVYQRIKEDATHREYFSISYITRTYGMGYSRAGKMFSRLQKEGIVALGGDARGCKVLKYIPQDSGVASYEQSTFIPDDKNMN